MYGKTLNAGCSVRAYSAASTDPTGGQKNEDYVYLALLNNGHLNGEPKPEPGHCRLSPARCPDSIAGPTETSGTSARRHRNLLFISGVMNLVLLLFLLPLAVTGVYLVVISSNQPTSRHTENEMAIGNASCMVTHLCTDALWEQFQDHFYWFSWQHVTWAQAREQCRHLGTDLASVHSRKENEFLVKKMLTKFRPGNRASGYYFWLGLMRDITTSDQRLVWVDGSGSTYQLWSEHQPDNEEGLEHCGQSSLSPGNRGRWADRRCWTQQPFVCKRRISPGTSD